MHQILGIVMIVLFALVYVVIGLFCLSVIEEERSKMRKGGDKVTPSSDMTCEELLGHVRKSDACC